MTGQQLLEILSNTGDSKSISFNYFYDGKNPVDLFSIPFDTIDDVMSIPRAYRYKGMTVTVLSGSTLNESGKPTPEEYWLVGGVKDENWEKKPYLTKNDLSGSTEPNESGQMLAVNDLLTQAPSAASPYDRYLVGNDINGYKIYEYTPISGSVELDVTITDFDWKHGVRILSKGLKNYVYHDNKLKTYDDVDCGEF